MLTPAFGQKQTFAVPFVHRLSRILAASYIVSGLHLILIEAKKKEIP